MILDEYVGIPFVRGGRGSSGVDCYGLVALVYANSFSIEIPSFTLISPDDTRKVFSTYMKEIKANWAEVKLPEVGDVIAMAYDPRHPRIVQHFGIYIGNGRMLHTLDNIGAHIVELKDYTYYIKGFYSWKK